MSASPEQVAAAMEKLIGSAVNVQVVLVAHPQLGSTWMIKLTFTQAGAGSEFSQVLDPQNAEAIAATLAQAAREARTKLIPSRSSVITHPGA